MLEESYAFQQFSANVDEEEAWIAEKQRLLLGGDLGDTMAAVQVCIFSKKRIFLSLTVEERGCSVVECLTQDQGVTGSSLTGGTVLCP